MLSLPGKALIQSTGLGFNSAAGFVAAAVLPSANMIRMAQEFP